MIRHCTCDISPDVVDVLLNSIILIIKFNDTEARKAHYSKEIETM